MRTGVCRELLRVPDVATHVTAQMWSPHKYGLRTNKPRDEGYSGMSHTIP